MSNLTHDQLLDLVETTLSWGSEVAEKWAGTLYQEQIDAQKELIRKELTNNNSKKVFDLVSGLALFLKDAEEKYDEYPESGGVPQKT